MTQNNERELIERLALVVIDLRRSHNGFDFIASLSELEAFAKAYKVAIDANDKSPISQNEQQEAFDKWLKANYPEYPPPLSKVWKAATQSSDSEINSLKQRVEELQADNLRLREALERIVKAEYNVYNCEDDYQGDVIGKLSDIHFKAYNKARKVLSSPPAQSLAEHDNEVIDRCKNIVADDALAITFQSMGAYRSAIIKQIGELKATP